MSFRFKGISSDTYFVVEKVIRTLLPPVNNTSVEVAGKPGAMHQKTDLGIRKHDFIIRMREENIDDLNGTIRTVAEWLFSEDPEELILEKEIDKYYMAQLDGDTDLEEIVRIGKGTLTFISYDPLAFDRVETMIPIASGAEASPIAVGGTYETFPYVKATFNQPTTFFSYATDKENEQVILGTAVDVAEQTAVPSSVLITDDTGANLTGWTTGNQVVDGTIAGTMKVTGDYFTYDSIGTGTGWHGPAIKKALPETLDNYVVDVWVKFNLPETKMVAKVDAYLYDVNGNIIGKLSLYDAWANKKDTWGVIGIQKETGKKHYMVNTHGYYQGVWNNFWGLLRLEKEGPKFHGYIGKVSYPSYQHHTRAGGYFTDTQSEFTADVAAIGIYIAGYGTYPMPAQNQIYVDRIQVYRKNLPEDNQIEYIAETGDVIEIDHSTKAVYKNGVPFKQKLNPFSNMFPLKPGDNAVGFQPNDVADIEISYRNRWL